MTTTAEASFLKDLTEHFSMPTADIDADQFLALADDKTGELGAQVYESASNYYQNGQYKLAASSFQSLALVEPGNPYYWIGLGASYQMLNDYTQALTSYAIAATLDETNPEIHYHAAECLFSVNQPQQGLAALSSAELIIAGNPDYAQLFEKIAWLKERWKIENEINHRITIEHNRS